MPNHLSDKEKKIISEVLKNNLRDLKDTEVILFGSMAKGNMRPTSDIDIAIKAQQPLDKSTWSKIESAFEESDLGREVDVVDYWRINEDFRKVIDQGGEKILATKSHPYRLCPTGYHWVSTHLREVPPSLRNPVGGLTEVDGHCRVNPGSRRGLTKEVFSSDEIKEMFNRFGTDGRSSLAQFKDLKKREWNRFDSQINFWTRFWNEMFNPAEKLDPTFVKALIASESGFRLSPPSQNAGSAGTAWGLIQITDEALEVMNADPKHELSDYKFKVVRDDLQDPNVSIAAGIRWLFHKKSLAGKALKRDASWKEALLNYKGYLPQYQRNPSIRPDGLKNFEDNYAELTSSSNSN